ALLLALVAACVSTPRPGWQDELSRWIEDPAAPALDPAALAPGSDGDPAAGDALAFDITHDERGRATTWRLAIEVLEIETVDAFSWRATQPFAQRVQPGEARRRERELAAAAFQAEVQSGTLDLTDLCQPTPVARLCVTAFDAAGAEVGTGESTAFVARLREGLLPACRAGHRQRATMRGRVDAGLDAPMLTVDDESLADIETVANGVESCTDFFQILRGNPVTRDILMQVLAPPSLWSVVTNWGVRVTFSVDFFAAEPIAAGRFAGAQGELWSLPMMLRLNDQPALLARVVVGPAGSPYGAAAGIYGIVARHPTDAGRRVFVRLRSSRRDRRSAG
ncbi:MAG: hypothetical protein KDE27_05970, partial [Planctomycetes bacterium]|nr:hypothetical protein [Planctomycetota bacterium]